MKTFEIDLDEFCEEIFHKMESIQDGYRSHKVTFKAIDKESCSRMIAVKLEKFIEENLSEYDNNS